ncbi:MAG: hypothetical protein KGL39_38580 [Patescibacteria group bacterium]|nr:hypothetical protein [Patescibacteria group bacterium]
MGDVTLGSQDIQALRDRGVSNPDEFASLDAAVLHDELRRFDSDPAVGAGALVHRLRQAERTSRTRAAVVQREAVYARSIVAWLDENFPEFSRPIGPHPAAVAAVIRLDYRDGKGHRSKRAWGREIRAAVADFERRFGELEAAA